MKRAELDTVISDLLSLVDEDDREHAHVEADAILATIIEDEIEGGAEIIAAYNRVPKWYA